MKETIGPIAAATLPNGAKVYVREVERRRDSSVSDDSGRESNISARQTGASGGTKKADANFEQIGATINGVAQVLKNSIDTIKPTKASVEFGFEIQAKSEGLIALFASVESTADIKITLEWGS